MTPLFPGVWKQGRDLFTKNLLPGYRSLSEKLVAMGGVEYRLWDPRKSKPAAAMQKGLKTFPLAPGKSVLYLGASSGSTASYFSDILGEEGVIYGVEVAERSIRDLTHLAQKRTNIVPILANVRMPESYAWIGPVDVVYQDVATDDQAEIMLRNAAKFLNPGGTAMMVIKSRSIDVVKNPREVYAQEKKKLLASMRVVEEHALDPFEKDHLFLVLEAKK